jgi:hypothetical protein
LDALRTSILGLQCGDLSAAQLLIRRLADSNSHFRDTLWVLFRCTAQRVLINQVLQARDRGELDYYESYYSDMIGEDQEIRLSQLYNNPVHFYDVGQLFKDAMSKSRKTTTNFFEDLQMLILSASYQSSAHPDSNLWDDVLTFLVNEVSRRRQRNTQDLSQSAYDNAKNTQEYQVIIRVAAHVAMSLLMNGRLLGDERSIRNYNTLIEAYIEYLIGVKNASSNPLSIEQVIFYIGFLVGVEKQSEVYVRFLITISDSTCQNRVKDLNQEYFSEALCRKFMVALAENGIYKEAGGRDNFF